MFEILHTIDTIAWRITQMKNVLKFLTLTLTFAAFGAISVISTFAQTSAEDCTAIYNKFLADRKGPDIPKYEAAVASGKEYLQKCKDIEGGEEVKAYIEKQLPVVEKNLAAAKDEEYLYKPFNASVPAKDWDKTFNLGKQIIAKNPDLIDVMLVLASVGFDNAFATPPVDKYNTDALNMAKMFLQKANEGKTSENWGAFSYVYKTKLCPDGKTNAIGWMNYTIGFITYNNLKNPKEGLPYLYKATQNGCETKDKIANVYRLIGVWYVDEFRRLEGEKSTVYAKLQKLELDVKAAPADAAGVTTKADLEKQFTDTEKIYNDIIALQKGYMERVVDAYFRAYKIAVADSKQTPEYRTALLNRAKEFYGFRFGKEKVATEFDSWSATLTTKPFPDPTSPVTPVVEAAPTTTTTPGSMATSADTTTNTVADTRPRTVNATTTEAKSAASSTTAPAKKTTPAPKKKGTR